MISIISIWRLKPAPQVLADFAYEVGDHDDTTVYGSQFNCKSLIDKVFKSVAKNEYITGSGLCIWKIVRKTRIKKHSGHWHASLNSECEKCFVIVD